MLSPRVSTPRRSAISPMKKTPIAAAAVAASPMRQLSRRSKVRVVSRVRPTSPGTKECVRKGDDGAVEISDDKTNQAESFKLDSCYGASDDLASIFKAEVEPVIPLLFCGCNSTVFAYGATGSGKTYTMQGEEENPGLMVLALQHIFSLPERQTKAKVELSYYELYMDRCYDLFEPKSGEVPVLEDSDGNVQLRGLAQIQVNSVKEFHDLFAKGCGNRKTGLTGVNAASSRSHSVLTVRITSADENTTSPLVGKLSFIDLAGSEDNRKSAMEGVRFLEGNKINQSFFVLSNVINALNANERRVPYRDSKLTRILQESLGGTSCAVMIACLNPCSYAEAAQTLRFAVRSRQTANPESTDSPADSDFKHSRRSLVKSPLKLSSPIQTKMPSKSPRFGQRLTLKRVQSGSFSCSKTETSYRESSIFSIVEDKPLQDIPPLDEGIFQDKPLQDIPSLETNAKPDEVEEACSSGVSYSSPAAKESINQSEELTSISNVQDDVPCTPRETVAESSESPPLSSMLRSFGSSWREALTPLPVNVTPTRSLLGFGDSERKVLPTIGWTAVEKFTNNSRDLQGTLLREYLDILNAGTKEDLLSLKGIGKKRADAILKLREENDDPPFNQLRDLQKIGLSAKQAEKIFQGSIVRNFVSML